MTLGGETDSSKPSRLIFSIKMPVLKTQIEKISKDGNNINYNKILHYKNNNNNDNDNDKLMMMTISKISFFS